MIQTRLCLLFQSGPIACTIAVTEDLENYSGGIFVDKIGRKSEDHEITVVGWGEEKGQKFWIIRNSQSKFEIVINCVFSSKKKKKQHQLINSIIILYS